MNHLTVNAIIKFISFDEVNEENLKLAADVNKHIIECPVCRKKISDIERTIDKMFDYSPEHIDDDLDFSIDSDIKNAVSDFYKD